MAKNVHAIWDGGIIQAMDTNDKALAASLEKDIEGLSEGKQTELLRGNQDVWVWESHELALADVYYKLHIPVEPAIFPANCNDAPGDITNFKPAVDSLYVDSMKPVVREQLEKGGLRLAKMLNESL